MILPNIKNSPFFKSKLLSGKEVGPKDQTQILRSSPKETQVYKQRK
jgi:hypothetical protein